MQIENLENDFKYYNESQISKEEYLELKKKNKENKVLLEDSEEKRKEENSKIQYFSE